MDCCEAARGTAELFFINLNLSDCLCDGVCDEVFNRLNMIAYAGGGLMAVLVAFSSVLTCLLCCLVCFVVRQKK